MNKSELIEKLAGTYKLNLLDAANIVNAFVDSMADQLKAGGRVEIRGFGTFSVREYAGYAGRNPMTGESVSVAPKKLPYFRASPALKDFMQG